MLGSSKLSVYGYHRIEIHGYFFQGCSSYVAIGGRTLTGVNYRSVLIRGYIK